MRARYCRLSKVAAGRMRDLKRAEKSEVSLEQLQAIQSGKPPGLCVFCFDASKKLECNSKMFRKRSCQTARALHTSFSYLKIAIDDREDTQTMQGTSLIYSWCSSMIQRRISRNSCDTAKGTRVERCRD